MINEGAFTEDWKKCNVFPIHKKIKIKKYQPISLLPAFSKVFERLVFNVCLTSF